MKVVVTGGAGFIGSHLVRALLKRGDRVRVIDNFSTGKEENLSDIISDIDLCRGDIRDEALLAEMLAGIDAVLHQAALPSVPRSFADPVGTTAVNIGGTLALLEAARLTGVKRFVFASSSSIYGNSPVSPKNESLPPGPLSPYAVSKLAGENYCRLYHKIYGIGTVSLRYFNVFGPGQSPDSQYAAVLPLFITAVLNSKQPVIYGDGTQSRDFTFIDNVVRANLLALDVPGVKGGEICNIACGSSTSLLDVIGLLEKFSGRRIEPRFDPPRSGDVKHSLASVEKAESILGYHPAVDFPEGLERTYKYFKESV